MLNVNEIRNLEDKWKIYKRKKYTKLVLYVVLLLIITVTPVLFYLGFFDKLLQSGSHTSINTSKEKKVSSSKSYKNVMKNEKKSTKKKIVKSKINIKNNTKKSNKSNMSNTENDMNLTKNMIVKNNTTTTNIDTNQVKTVKKSIKDRNVSLLSNNNDMLQLNTNFLNHIYSNKTDKNRSKTASKQNITQNNNIANKSGSSESNMSNIKKSTPEKIAPKPKKPKIIISSKKIDKLKYLIERYNESGRAMYAVMISKEYYRKKMYKKSLIWATTANSIDSSNEESWIMFAKSKVKLNQKNDAINALKAYLKVNSSKKINILLTNIINGVFK